MSDALSAASNIVRPGSGTMGIRGVMWQNVGNLTAVAVICGIVVYQVRDSSEKGQADRQMFREELRDQRLTADRNFDRVVSELNRLRVAMEANTRAITGGGKKGPVEPNGVSLLPSGREVATPKSADGGRESG